MFRWGLISGVFALAIWRAWAMPGYWMLGYLAAAAVAALMIWGFERT